MAKGRISVEWGFGDIYNVWRRLRDPDKQTLLAGVPAIQMQLGFFLANVRNCVHPNQIAQVFCADGRYNDCPTLEDYIAVTMEEAKHAADYGYPSIDDLLASLDDDTSSNSSSSSDSSS